MNFKADRCIPREEGHVEKRDQCHILHVTYSQGHQILIYIFLNNLVYNVFSSTWQVVNDDVTVTFKVRYFFNSNVLKDRSVYLLYRCRKTSSDYSLKWLWSSIYTCFYTIKYTPKYTTHLIQWIEHNTTPIVKDLQVAAVNPDLCSHYKL